VAAPRSALPLAAASIGWVHLADAGEMPSSTSTAATPRAAHDALAGALTGCRALLTLTPSQMRAAVGRGSAAGVAGRGCETLSFCGAPNSSL
jgi:hypothetical protein